jgi:hypothetical protein
MKSKKKEEMVDSKLSHHVEKLKNVLNSHESVIQPNHQTGRLKVFKQVCDRSLSKK